MPDHTSAWAQYTLILKDRENIQSRLNAAGIPSVVYYPIPLSRQLGYQKFPCVSTEVKTSEQLSKKVLSLPMHPYLTETSQDRVVSEILSN
jgi:dTDP-4-amino-4,6-dideoxygalactose transaminase